MAIYRQIQTSFWQDGFVSELTPEEKYFYFYLLTNSRTTQCGIYEINMKIMVAETGYNRETLEKLIKRFEGYGKIAYCAETRELMILNWIKYNFINSRNTMMCINKELKEVKNKQFITKFYKICLTREYDVVTVFQGVNLNAEDKGKDYNAEVVNKEYTDRDEITEDNEKDFSEGLHRGLEGACNDLGEEEIKEKIINNNKEQNKSAKNNYNKVLLEFDKNIRKATIRDTEKILLWLKDFQEEVIIQTILEAVNHDAAHIGYVESIVKNWKALGLFTMEKLKAYMKKSSKEKKYSRCNAEAYKYLD